MQNQRYEAELGHLNRAFTQNQKFHKNLGLKWTKSSATQPYILAKQPWTSQWEYLLRGQHESKSRAPINKKFGQPVEFSANWTNYGGAYG